MSLQGDRAVFFTAESLSAGATSKHERRVHYAQRGNWRKSLCKRTLQGQTADTHYHQGMCRECAKKAEAGA